jgi:hypothetical protein
MEAMAEDGEHIFIENQQDGVASLCSKGGYPGPRVMVKLDILEVIMILVGVNLSTFIYLF